MTTGPIAIAICGASGYRTNSHFVRLKGLFVSASCFILRICLILYKYERLNVERYNVH